MLWDLLRDGWTYAIVLRNFFRIRKEISTFLNKYVSSNTTELEEQLKSTDFLKQLDYLTDITTYLNNLNLNFQSRNQMVSDLIKIINGFRKKIRNFQNFFGKIDLSHFPSCKQLVEELSDETKARN